MIPKHRITRDHNGALAYIEWCELPQHEQAQRSPNRCREYNPGYRIGLSDRLKHFDVKAMLKNEVIGAKIVETKEVDSGRFEKNYQKKEGAREG